MAKLKAQRVTMYSRDAGGRVIAHHLPWEEGSPKYQAFLARGFTYDRPDDGAPASPSVPADCTATQGFPCPTCQKKLPTKLALSGHMRSHRTTAGQPDAAAVADI